MWLVAWRPSVTASLRRCWKHWSTLSSQLYLFSQSSVSCLKLSFVYTFTWVWVVVGAVLLCVDWCSECLNCVMCSEVSKRHRKDQNVAVAILDMTNQLIPHLRGASQSAECCSQTLSNSRTTLVNTFGVYWTKRGDLYNPATRCAIVRCMTNFILVCWRFHIFCYRVCIIAAEYYVCQSMMQWLCYIWLSSCVVWCRLMRLQCGQCGSQLVLRVSQRCWMSCRELCQTKVWVWGWTQLQL